MLSATKILWGQILVVSVIVLAAVWGATQWTAWRLGYQPQLGGPWTEIAGTPVYPPPAFFLWWYWFDAYAPRIFVEGAIIASSGGFAAIAVAIGEPPTIVRTRSESLVFRLSSRLVQGTRGGHYYGQLRVGLSTGSMRT